MILDFRDKKDYQQKYIFFTTELIFSGSMTHSVQNIDISSSLTSRKKVGAENNKMARKHVVRSL